MSRETFHPIHSNLSSSELAKIAEEKASEIQSQYDIGVITPGEYLHQMQAVFMTAVLDMEER